MTDRLTGKTGQEVAALINPLIKQYSEDDPYANIDDCMTLLRKSYSDVDEYRDSIEDYLLWLLYPEHVRNPFVKGNYHERPQHDPTTPPY